MSVPVRIFPSIAPLAAIAAYDQPGGDPARQYGPNPVLPEPRQSLLPPMSVPKAVGWSAGQAPTPTHFHVEDTLQASKAGEPVFAATRRDVIPRRFC